MYALLNPASITHLFHDKGLCLITKIPKSTGNSYVSYVESAKTEKQKRKTAQCLWKFATTVRIEWQLKKCSNSKKYKTYMGRRLVSRIIKGKMWPAAIVVGSEKVFKEGYENRTS